MTKRATRGLYHGYLVIDKPAGWTSHDVVSRVRRIVGERRVGHAGTLDPAAVGVLPVAVGMATRTIEYLADASKAYVADITFGVTTDSADGDGIVTSVSEADGLTPERVEAALDRFRGDQMQIPPMHSAIKIDGERLYERARRGEDIRVAPRPITIHQLKLLNWAEPTATIFVSCSKGTYIRSLARDLGEAVGTGAYMSNLVRVQTGPFTLADAIRIDDLPALMEQEPWELIAYHPDIALQDLPVLVLDDLHAHAWRQGKEIVARAVAEAVRVYDASGEWLGIGRPDDTEARVRPIKVVANE